MRVSELRMGYSEIALQHERSRLAVEGSTAHADERDMALGQPTEIGLGNPLAREHHRRPAVGSKGFDVGRAVFVDHNAQMLAAGSHPIGRPADFLARAWLRGVYAIMECRNSIMQFANSIM